MAVRKSYHPPAVLGNVGFVGYQDDSDIGLGVELDEKLHNFDTGFGVQVAGRFVGQYYGSVVYQSPPDGNPLLLSPESWLGLWCSLPARPTKPRASMALIFLSLACTPS